MICGEHNIGGDGIYNGDNTIQNHFLDLYFHESPSM